MTDDLTTLAALADTPTGSIPMSAIVIVTYIDGDGDPAITVATIGAATLTETMGCLAWASHTVASGDTP